jgi:UDP-glucose:(heptosyl)LPS alpha-1,3-glucosyltransferase
MEDVMNESRHIMLIRSTYSSSGGVERVTLSLLKGLVARGVRTTLLTCPRQQWPVSDPGLDIVELGISGGHRLVHAWVFNRAVGRYLAHHRADCVLSLDKVDTFTHLHAGGGTHKTFLRIRNRNSGALARWVRTFSPFHRYILHLEARGFRNPMLQKVRCNSSLVRADIVNDYGVAQEKLVLIHSGIRWREMAAAFEGRKALAEELGRRHGLSPDGTHLLFLGSGYARKGLDVALEGLAGMTPDTGLIVVGKGSIPRYRRKARSLGIDDRVHFLGPQPDGWRFAALCKAVVLPSHYDPFGGAAAEGHAMGLPVLVSDKTGYADWIDHGRNGIILETPMTAERISSAFRALAHLIAHPLAPPDEIRQRARNVDDDVILDRLLESFLDL